MLLDFDNLVCRAMAWQRSSKELLYLHQNHVLPQSHRIGSPQPCGAVQGLLVDDMLPDFDKPTTQTHGTATWLGTCRPQGSPYVRRLDIKVFPRWCAPAGLDNHLTA